MYIYIYIDIHKNGGGAIYFHKKIDEKSYMILKKSIRYKIYFKSFD